MQQSHQAKKAREWIVFAIREKITQNTSLLMEKLMHAIPYGKVKKEAQEGGLYKKF